MLKLPQLTVSNAGSSILRMTASRRLCVARNLIRLRGRHTRQRLLATSVDSLNMRIFEPKQEGELSSVRDEGDEEDGVRSRDCYRETSASRLACIASKQLTDRETVIARITNRIHWMRRDLQTSSTYFQARNLLTRLINL